MYKEDTQRPEALKVRLQRTERSSVPVRELTVFPERASFATLQR